MVGAMLRNATVAAPWRRPPVQFRRGAVRDRPPVSKILVFYSVRNRRGAIKDECQELGCRVARKATNGTSDIGSGLSIRAATTTNGRRAVVGFVVVGIIVVTGSAATATSASEAARALATDQRDVLRAINQIGDGRAHPAT